MPGFFNNMFFRLVFKLFLACVVGVAALYFFPQSPPFPKPPQDSIQSLEKADVETPFRRAYFTSFSREEILKHYERELGKTVIPWLTLTLRLTYPPEDAQVLIRDQTRSVHLPEIVHPGRESLFVNIFEAQTPKDAITYRGYSFERKITVRYIPTSPLIRLIILVPTFLLFLYLLEANLKSLLLIIKKVITK